MSRAYFLVEADVIMDETSSGFEDDVSLSPASPAPKVEDEDEDDDKYEDSLDLDTSQANTKVWLVRMPQFLLDRWRDTNEIANRELGKVRIRKDTRPFKVRLTLNDSELVRDLPHEYDLTLVHQTVQNTYVFKEQELSHKERSASRAIKMEAADGAPVIQNPSSGPAAPLASSFDRYTPVIRNTPKRTAIVGQACHECLVTPDVTDPNYKNVVIQRRRMDQPSRQVSVIRDLAGMGGAKYAETLRMQKQIWARQQQRKDIFRSGEGKATRIPRNELYDKLFRLFEEQECWTLRGLREVTRQPEVYLHEVLDTIAVLNKKGPNAMKYELKAEFRQMKGNGLSVESMVEKTPGSHIKEEYYGDDSDEDMDMETVL